MGVFARRPTPILRGRSPTSLRLIRAGQAAAGFASEQEADLAAHPQAPAKTAAFFAERPAAVERGQDRRGARGAGDGPRRGGLANHPRLVARRQSSTPLAESVDLARIRRFARQGRPRLSGRPPALRRLPQRWRTRRGACRPRRLGARSGPHRGGSRAHEPGAHQGGSAGVAQRSRSPVLQDPVRPPRRARLRGGGPAEPRAARSRRARQSGSMVERAEDGRPHAARPRRAATCL